MRTNTNQPDGRLSDENICSIISNTVFTFRDDKDLTNQKLLDGMLECKYIDALQYFRTCTEKWQMLRLVSVTNYYIKNQSELWQYFTRELPRDQLLRHDRSGPISDRYLDLIFKYTPIKNWFRSWWIIKD